MDELLEDITPQDLFDFARVIPVPEDFVLTNRFVPTRKIPGIRYSMRSRSTTTSAAKFRAWDTETPRGRRVVEALRTEGELPPLGVKFHIGEREQILLDAIRTEDDSLLIDEVYQDAQRAVLGIYARLELAAGDMLNDGKFVIDDDDYTVEVDWQVPNDHRPTAPVLWNNANANPIDDEENAIRVLVAKGKGRPGAALASDRVYSFLGANAQYRQSYFGSTEGSYRNLVPAEVDSVRAARRLPPLTLVDHQIDVDGQSVRVLDDNKLLLLPSDSSRFAETQYGITAEALTLRAGGQLEIERSEESGVFVTKKVLDDPISVTTRGTATAMPVMYDPEGYVALKVLA